MTASEAPPPTIGQSALARIRSQLGGLSPSERRVAEFVLEHPDEVIHMTVSEVAEQCGSAESSTVRCCRSLGFKGFQQLKISLARETVPLTHYVYDRVDPSDAHGDVLMKVMGFSAQVIHDAASSIEPERFDKAVSMLAQAQSIIGIGYGASGGVIRSARDQFASIGLDMKAPEDANLKHLTCETAEPTSCALIVSHTGVTRDVVRCAKILKRQGVPTVAITSFPHTRLTDQVDVALVASGRELSFRFEALSGRLVHMAVVDALYVALARENPERARRMLDLYYQVDSAWRV